MALRYEPGVEGVGRLVEVMLPLGSVLVWFWPVVGSSTTLVVAGVGALGSSVVDASSPEAKLYWVT